MRSGITYPEIIIVISIMLTLLGLAVVNLLPPQHQAATSSTVATLLADLRSQQLKSIVGRGGGGIYFSPTTYSLFSGLVYSSSAPANFTVTPPGKMTFASTLLGNQVVFATGSGEVVGYSSQANSITITNTNNFATVTVTINAYGIPTIN